MNNKLIFKEFFRLNIIYLFVFLSLISVGSFIPLFKMSVKYDNEIINLRWLFFLSGLFTTSIASTYLLSRVQRMAYKFALNCRNFLYAITFFKNTGGTLTSNLFASLKILLPLFIYILCIQSFDHLASNGGIASPHLRFFIDKKILVSILASSLLLFIISSHKRFTIMNMYGMSSLLFLGISLSVVDQSRYSALPFSLIILQLALIINPNYRLQNFKYLVSTGKIRLNQTIRLFILILIVSFLVLIFLRSFSGRFTPYALLGYITAYSYNSIGVYDIGPNIYDFSFLAFDISGLPLFGDFGDRIRIHSYQPLPGLFQVSSLLNSYFMGGVIFGFAISVPIYLVCACKSKTLRYISFLLICSTIVTLCQYDIRMTARILQFSSLVCLIGLEQPKVNLTNCSNE